MGGAGSSERPTLADDGIVTVNIGSNDTPRAEADILERLSRLPQVKLVKPAKGPEDQLWRDLTSFSQDQLQLDPKLTLRVLNTYKMWCQSQANTVAQQQDFVHSRIGEVDTLASYILEECDRRQQTLQTMTQAFNSLAATQQQMQELSSRLAACSSVIAAADDRQAQVQGNG